MADTYSTITFVNLGHQHAIISVTAADGSARFIAAVGVGQAIRQYTPVGAMWHVKVGSDAEIPAEASGTICLITDVGIDVVTATVPIPMDFPTWGGTGP